MTVLQRIVHAIAPRHKFDATFEGYYSRLLRSGATGVPSAREAQQDLADMRERNVLHRYI
jgi:hypothetical protein